MFKRKIEKFLYQENLQLCLKLFRKKKWPWLKIFWCIVWLWSMVEILTHSNFTYIIQLSLIFFFFITFKCICLLLFLYAIIKKYFKSCTKLEFFFLLKCIGFLLYLFYITFNRHFSTFIIILYKMLLCVEILLLFFHI